MKTWIKFGIPAVVALGVAVVGAVGFKHMNAGLETLVEYQTTGSNDMLELRSYPSILVAQVTLQENMLAAKQEGEKILTDYFNGGNNFAKTIPMHAPIFVQEDERTSNRWKVYMLMPEKYRTEPLPKQNDERIEVLVLPAQTFAAVSFSGDMTQSQLDQQYQKLITGLKQQRIVPDSKPIYAFYKPDWVASMFQMAEVMTFVPADLKLEE